MTREHAEVPEQVEARRRHSGNETGQEIVRFKHDGARAITPHALECELDASVRSQFEALLGQRRAREVPAKPLDLRSVASIDDLLGMHIDAANFGGKLVGSSGVRSACGATCGRCLLRNDEPQCGLASAITRHADALRSGSVASGEPGLVERDCGWLVVLHLRVERAAVGLKDLLDAVGCAACDVGDLGVSRRRQDTEHQRAVRSPSDVDAIEREHVGVYVESEGAVGPLNRAPAPVCASATLRSPSMRLALCFSERLSSPTKALTTSEHKERS